MSARKRLFSARPISCALLLLLGQLGCSPKYELLRTLGESEAGASFSAAGGQAVGGTIGVGATDAGGSTAASRSGSGGSDSGGYSSGGTGYGGGGSGGYVSHGGVSSAGGNGLGEACTTHGQCAFGTVCGDYSCQACPAEPASCPGPCAYGFQPLLIVRNGCGLCECVPPSQCTGNADCQNGETCYAGTQCQDGCSDPTCCFGNHCSQPGCEGTRPPLCLAFGCSNGGSCLAACDATSCACDGAGWICENTTGGAPVASCPQACAPR